jgi:hypothetical protein
VVLPIECEFQIHEVEARSQRPTTYDRSPCAGQTSVYKETLCRSLFMLEETQQAVLILELAFPAE